jgi:hypothetical protein
MVAPKIAARSNAEAAILTKMITAHVNDQGIVLRFSSLTENFSPETWEKLLDELKSEYLPGFYQIDKRMYVASGGGPQIDALPAALRVVIYFTPKTVDRSEAVGILSRYNVTVHDLGSTA